MGSDIEAAKLRVDAACPCWDTPSVQMWIPCRRGDGTLCQCQLEPKDLPWEHKCIWPVHRLARELATVAQERMRERAQDCLTHKIVDEGIAEELDVDGKPIDAGIAALPLEGTDE